MRIFRATAAVAFFAVLSAGSALAQPRPAASPAPATSGPIPDSKIALIDSAAFGDDKQGTISAFAINRADGSLKLLNTVRSGGAGPTYVSMHPGGRFLLVANYFGGSVAVLPIWPTVVWGTPRTSRTMPARLAPPSRRTLHRAALPLADTTGLTHT